jgi:hypothetical protein
MLGGWAIFREASPHRQLPAVAIGGGRQDINGPSIGLDQETTVRHVGKPGNREYYHSAGSCFFVSLKFENIRDRNVDFRKTALSTDAAKMPPGGSYTLTGRSTTPLWTTPQSSAPEMAVYCRKGAQVETPAPTMLRPL